MLKWRIDAEDVARYVEAHPGQTCGQIAEAMGWHRETIRYTLRDLAARDRVSYTVPGKRTRRWYPTWRT